MKLDKKTGLFRSNIEGKRVNYSARSVISPDINLKTDEVGMSTYYAMKVTFPMKVN